MQKRVTNSYFTFTRKEKNGTIFLLIIVLLITAIPFLYSFIFTEKITASNDLQHELLVLKEKEQVNAKKYYQHDFEKKIFQQHYQPVEKNYYSSPLKASLFNFDPNTISGDDWKKLGIRNKTISTIQNFIAKGGKFREAEDIKKIWGLHEDEIQRLLPFVKIEKAFPSAKTENKIPVVNKYESKKTFEKIDINLADTGAFIKLPGIGSKLANRIINFRDKLGGFYSIEQVGETFGLPDSVFQKIRPSLVLADQNLKKININTATIDELKQHPYIRYNLGNLIIQYRTQHGNFLHITDLKKIMTVDENLYNKLADYLTVQ